MNKRYLIYGLVAVVLALGLGGEEPNPHQTKLQISLKDREALKTLCLEEIIGFDSGVMGKLKFCQCVSDEYSKSILTAQKFKTEFEKVTTDHGTELNVTRTKARNIANAGGAPMLFKTGDSAFNVLIERFEFSFSVKELDPLYENLAKASGKIWKRSMYQCSQKKSESKK